MAETGNGQPTGGDPQALEVDAAHEAALLRRCQSIFLKAAESLQEGDQDEAQRHFKAVVGIEPRLPEPHLELAVIYFRKGQLDDAIEEARVGLDLLEHGGQWLENLTLGQMLGHARNLLGELLVERAKRDALDLEPDELAELWNEAVCLFKAAVEADPDNDTARKNALLHRT
jgi:tetratricopeptide (TPR) repeat protein